MTVSSDEIFRNGVALLAFVMAFYALVARERKTPFMVHSVYRITFLVLISLTFSAFSSILKSVNPWWSEKLALSSAATLLIGMVYVYVKIWMEHNRHVCYRSDQLLRNLKIIRFLYDLRSKLSSKMRYEHNAMSLPPKLIKSLRQSPFLPIEQIDRAVLHHASSSDLSIAAALHVSSLVDTDQALTDIAIRFLENDCFVQYTSCSRHPIEFLLQLSHQWTSRKGDDSWKKVKNQMVVVDAYTPHFGFTDTIYREKTKLAEGKCIGVVTSKPTFAGVHTAIAKAFNLIKKEEKGAARDVRSPTLVVYEGVNSLSDLESNEQYRIFLRHVIPSEKLWGGMFTLFVESGMSPENTSLLDSLVSVSASLPLAKEQSSNTAEK